MTTTDFTPIPLPLTEFYPPFNITRASHYSLTVRDLDTSLRFYCGVIGLMVTERTATTAYLRGAEEACHHSLILRQSDGPATCGALGFRVLTDAELDRAYDWALDQKLTAEWLDAPYQSRTLQLHDPAGTPIELCAHMPVMERHMGHAVAGLCFAKRLDHFQVLNPHIDACTAFYTQLGFRISDAIIVDGQLEACFLWRKGSVSDLVLMEGDGPRLHHAAFLVRKPDDILRACDMVGELRFPPMTTEEGPGRHGMDGAYYIYFRDPDGHRIELFDGHYQTIDAELEPKQYPPEVAAPPWGLPTLSSWFNEGSAFAGTTQTAAPRPRNAPTMEDYVRAKS
jgi:catechol 2,3-dioxygenase